MAFNSKTFTLGLCFLLCSQMMVSDEVTLAEQKEKSLEERYRRLLAFSHMGDLQARKSHAEKLKKAKEAWDLQRLALGKEVYRFKEKELHKPIPQNDLDHTSKDLIPLNHFDNLGQMNPTEFPTNWIETKIAALNYLITLPAPQKNYMISPSIQVSLNPPKDLKQWKLWQFFESQNEWKMLKTGEGMTPVDLLPSKSDISAYTFLGALKHPLKLEQVNLTKVELDLQAPKLIKASWSRHFESGIQLSWDFHDRNFAEGNVIVLIEHKRQERSRILIHQKRQDAINLEPKFAKWAKSVSFLVYDLAGHTSTFHFDIKH